MSELRYTRARNLFIVLLSVFFCVLVAGIVSLSFLLPQQVADRFGTPSPDLVWWEHLFYSMQLFYYKDDLNQPAAPQSELVEFRIDYGESASSVAQKLFDQQLILNPKAFEVFLAFSGLDRTIQAGVYQIDAGMNSIEIAMQIQDATPTEVDFVILPGWRMEEIAMAFPTSGFSIDPDDFLRFAREPDAALILQPAGWPEGASLEGIYLPGEYRFRRDITLVDFNAFFIQQFTEIVELELKNGFERQGLTLWEGIVLASIVEKEAMLSDEQPIIASVFLNRLNQGIRLESDPTVQYSAGFIPESGTWWKNPLTLNDLAIDSPYNTYIYPSLPPGPICSPSLSALRSVAFPAQTTYLYFRAGCDGSGHHKFANTYEEHLKNACLD